MCKIREIDFLLKQFADSFDCVTFVETFCWNYPAMVLKHMYLALDKRYL